MATNTANAPAATSTSPSNPPTILSALFMAAAAHYANAPPADYSRFALPLPLAGEGRGEGKPLSGDVRAGEGRGEGRRLPGRVRHHRLAGLAGLRALLRDQVVYRSDVGRAHLQARVVGDGRRAAHRLHVLLAVGGRLRVDAGDRLVDLRVRRTHAGGGGLRCVSGGRHRARAGRRD